MILMIAGATHSGKTVLAQKVLEEYKYPYLSFDHLKMGLIRSGNTDLTPISDEESLTGYLWPIVREIIKTAVENGQNLVIEGCYIPFDWEKDFEEQYLREIRYVCLVLSENYIRTKFEDIRAHASDIEERLDDTDCTMNLLIRDNNKNLQLCQECGCRYILIEDAYSIDLQELFRG